MPGDRRRQDSARQRGKRIFLYLKTLGYSQLCCAAFRTGLDPSLPYPLIQGQPGRADKGDTLPHDWFPFSDQPLWQSPRNAVRLGLVLLVVAGLLVVGCTPDTAQVQYNKKIFELWEQQKAQQALDEDPLLDLPEITPAEHERLGDHHLRQGNRPMALVHYYKAIEADPSLTRAHYKIGLMFLQKDLADEALARFQEMLKHDADSLLAREGMGQTYLRMRRDEEAEQEFRKALKLDPDRWQSHNFLGLLYDRQMQHGKAIVEYKAALGLRPAEAVVHNNLGFAYYLSGLYHLAVRAFQQAIVTGLDNSKIHNNLGLAYAKLGQYPDALKEFKRATGEAQAYNNLGLVYLSAGNARAAVSCLEKAIELHPRYYLNANENLALAKKKLQVEAEYFTAQEGDAGVSCP